MSNTYCSTLNSDSLSININFLLVKMIKILYLSLYLVLLKKPTNFTDINFNDFDKISIHLS